MTVSFRQREKLPKLIANPQSVSVVVLVIGPLQGTYLQWITQTQRKIRISSGPDGTGIRYPN